ncbi:MAG: hypothetical protein KDA21_04695 [Phycisphaerales bacterium]|nr:hypothetical protein [Phycisphaerales bacterium]
MNLSTFNASLAAALLAAAITPAGAAPASENGALIYWQAWTIMDRTDNPAFDVDLQALGEPGWEPSEEVAAALQDMQSGFDLLEEAAAKPWCDFGVQYEKGPAALLPHLGIARKFCRAMLEDARIRLDAGDTAGFTGRMSAALGMSEDLAEESTVISALVSTAMFSAARPLLDYALDSGRLTDADRARLAACLSNFDSADPFFIRGSVGAEGEVMGRWMRDEVFDPQVLAEIIAARAAGQLDQMSPRATEVYEMVAGLFDVEDIAILDVVTTEGFDPRREVALYRRFMSEASATFADRDGGKQLDVLAERLVAGEYGTLAKLMVPAMGRLHQNYWKSRDMFDAVQERLAE